MASIQFVVGQQISFLAGGDLLAHAQTLKEQHPHTCSFDLVPKVKVLPSGFNSYVAEERTPKARSYARLHIRPLRSPDGRQDRSPLTVLGDCRWGGGTLVEVALEHWNPKDKPPNYYIFVERRFARCYAVHFPYNARPFGNVAKVLRLKNHLPQRRCTQP